MAIKQRFQNPVLGDTIRLQNFVYNNAGLARISGVAKVEIYRLDPALTTASNPQGQVLRETIVSHFGLPDTEIFAEPSVNAAEYWESRVEIDPDTWSTGTYRDRWFLIHDPDLDFLGPVAHSPLDDDDYEVEVSGNEVTFTVPLVQNRKIRLNGITNTSGTALTVTDAQAAYIDANSDLDTPMTIPVGFFTDPMTVIGFINVDGKNAGCFKLTSSNGITWTVTLSAASGSPVLTALDASLNDGDMVITGLWSAPVGVSADDISLHLQFVEEWKIEGVTYDPSQPNAWDDAWDRTPATLKTTYDHEFKINPDLWAVTPRPVPFDYVWNINPSSYFINTVNWMRVSVRPNIPEVSALDRYAISMLSAGQMTYEIFRLSSTGEESRLIASGEVTWHEENTALVRIDTTRSPLNRGMDVQIVFKVTLPDGTIARSARISFQVIDDSRRGDTLPYGVR